MKNTVMHTAGLPAGHWRTWLTVALVLASLLSLMATSIPAYAQPTANATNLGTTAVPSEARSVPPRCRGWFSLYDGYNYTGSYACFRIGSRHLGVYSPRFDRLTSSAWNDTPYVMCVYTAPYYGGSKGYFPPYSANPHLPPGWDNTIRSLQRMSNPDYC